VSTSSGSISVKSRTSSLASISARCEPIAPTPTTAMEWRLTASCSTIEALRRYLSSTACASPIEESRLEFESVEVFLPGPSPEVTFEDIWAFAWP